MLHNMKMKRNNFYSSISPRKIITLIIILIIFVIFIFSCFAQGRPQDNTKEIPDFFAEATVKKIVDGDTFWIEQDGTSEKVRLIGLNAPELLHYEQQETDGDRATAFLGSILQTGQIVYLQQDISDTDAYNRLLRYVWLEKPTDKNSKEEIQGKMVNAMVIATGNAVAKDYPPDTFYSEIFSNLQKEAEKNKAGLWNPDLQ